MCRCKMIIAGNRLELKNWTFTSKTSSMIGLLVLLYLLATISAPTLQPLPASLALTDVQLTKNTRFESANLSARMILIRYRADTVTSCYSV